MLENTFVVSVLPNTVYSRLAFASCHITYLQTKHDFCLFVSARIFNNRFYLNLFKVSYCFLCCRDLMEELVVYIREAVDRKQENMRRRRRRDALRLQLVRVLEKIAENGTFGVR